MTYKKIILDAQQIRAQALADFARQERERKRAARSLGIAAFCFGAAVAVTVGGVLWM